MFVVPFTRLLWLSTRLDSRNAWAMLAHAATEISWLLFWYSWLMGRGWPWVQRCFFVLHIVVNWMKMHSYLSTNRMLAGMLRTRTELAKKKDSATADLDMALNKTTVSFPASVTLANYVMFQLSPTLVYELEYPRTKSIRWGYVLEKILGTMGIFFVFYIVVAHLVLPRLEKMPEAGVLVTTVHLMGPMATCWLLFFFITFDSIANGFAELTRFADRRFYDDWWNARGLDEFSRKWNRPVHMFLARHVYMPIRQNWRGAVPASVAAMGLTFLFSSVLHEVTLTVACSRWNHGLFFIFQMMQVPVIVFSEKVAWFKDCQAMRNWFFWVAMVIGQPYLLCMYTYGAFATKSVSIYQQSSSPSVQANGTNAGM
ncbi:Sterol O-acyltransferase 2 (Sterol-ester synthase 2) [Linderina pennispora]|nr:Sterol O-acyltransferase 2 (Sterol-ester synthase 2) [Linderina pennispora]